MRSARRSLIPFIGAVALTAFGVVYCTHSERSTSVAARSLDPARSVNLPPVSPGPSNGCWVPGLASVTPLGERFALSEGNVFVAILPGSSPRVREVAALLARQLERIVGKKYGVREVSLDLAKGALLLTTQAQAPAVAAGLRATAEPDPQSYLIRSERARVLLVSMTEDGLEYAVWDFLHQLGYRHYFPGPTWEITPRLERAVIQTDRLCRPAFQQRDLTYGYGDWPENKADDAEWLRANRLGGASIELGHNYEAIIKANAREFAEHPEFLGSGPSTKFCVNAAGLVDLVINQAKRHFETNPRAISMSLDPSDGGGWEGCPDDSVLGSPSNRTVTLANAVARAINDPSRHRFVSIYAYGEHSSPPTIPVDPNVVVYVATRYFPPGNTVRDLMAGWRAAGARVGGTLLGIREYYSVNAWDRDRPGAATASAPRSLANSLREYYQSGARFFSTEAGDGWGPHGLGYWVAAASLWTADNPVPTDRYVDDFLQGAFRNAAATMREFYEAIDGDNTPLLSKEFVGELFRILARARQAEKADDVRRRLDALALYTHYLDLWLDYQFSDPSNHQATFDGLMQYTYSIRRQHMVHSFGLRRDLSARDHEVTLAPITDAANALETSLESPITTADIDRWSSESSARPRLPRPPSPAPDEKLARLPRRGRSPSDQSKLSLRGAQKLDLLFDGPRQLALAIQGGTVEAKGRIRLTLCPAAVGQGSGSCLTESVEADRAAHDVTFEVPAAGHYELHVEDWTQGVILSWPPGTSVSLNATQRQMPSLWDRWTLYFYVPRGVREIVMYTTGGLGVLRNPRGDVSYNFDKRPGLVRVPVPPGQDGDCWKFDSNMGSRLLLNVPPWLAASPDELLVPSAAIVSGPKPRGGGVSGPVNR